MRNLADSDISQDNKRFYNNIKREREEFSGNINIILLISRKYRLNINIEEEK